MMILKETMTTLKKAMAILKIIMSNKHGKLHIYDDRLAVIHDDGTEKWYKNNQLHSYDDKPALIKPDGTQEWYQNDQLHRDGDKPAVILPNGTKMYYQNGKLIKIEREKS